MILTTIALVAQASPAPNAKIAAIAKAWFIALQHGKILDASQLTPAMVAGLTPTVVAGLGNKLGPLGDPTGFTQVKAGTQGDQSYYAYDVTFKTGDDLTFLIVFDAGGKISGIRFPQPQ